MRVVITIVFAVLVAATLGRAEAQTAKLQLIHDIADPAVGPADIYVNGGLLAKDVAFRSATDFMDVPAGESLRVVVAPGGSASPIDSLAGFRGRLQPGKSYVAVASGVHGSGFMANPDGRSIAVRLFFRQGVRTDSGDSTKVRLVTFQGVTDAPALDLRIRRDNRFVKALETLRYGKFTGTQFLRAMDYILDVTLANDSSNVLSSYRLDLADLGGKAALLFASGFLTPTGNSGGPPFGLYLALPDGAVRPLPPYLLNGQTAQVQFIQNAADSAAATLDLYLNGFRIKDDFAFRTATRFLEVPVRDSVNLVIAPGNSSSVADSLRSFRLALKPSRRYVVMTTGVAGSDLAPNPDGRRTGVTLVVQRVTRIMPDWQHVRVLFFNGGTDVPAIDVRAWQGDRSRGMAFRNVQYGVFQGPEDLPARPLVLDLVRANEHDRMLGTYVTDLRRLAGSSIVVLASGFLHPSANRNGPEMGLLAALPDGRVIPLRAQGNSMEDATAAVPEAASFALWQNVPNPFNPRTQISFSLPEKSPVRLQVFNARGQLVRTLVEGTLPAGTHFAALDATALPSGAYFYRLVAGNQTQTRKMLLVK